MLFVCPKTEGGAAEILPEEEGWVDFTGFCDEDIEICPVGKPAGFFDFLK